MKLTTHKLTIAALTAILSISCGTSTWAAGTASGGASGATGASGGGGSSGGGGGHASGGGGGSTAGGGTSAGGGGTAGGGGGTSSRSGGTAGGGGNSGGGATGNGAISHGGGGTGGGTVTHEGGTGQGGTVSHGGEGVSTGGTVREIGGGQTGVAGQTNVTNTPQQPVQSDATLRTTGRVPGQAAGAVNAQATGQTNTQTMNNANTAQTANRRGGQRLEGEHRLRNPYAREGLRNGQYNPVYYSYPWLPFSYGYNNDWYGNYNGNNNGNQYPFFIPNEGNNDNDPNENQNGTYVTPPSPAQTATTPAATPQQSVATTPELQAQITNSVDKSPALVTANNSVALAQSALDSERERVEAALRQKPEYQQAMQRRHKAAADVHSVQNATNGAPTNAVVAAANEKLDASDEVTKMEADAVATDPAASAAKARLDQAIADRNALRAQLTVQYQSAAKGG